MKLHFLVLLLVVSALGLSACETHREAKAQPKSSAPLKQDFLTTGRGLSNGSVDLYQPGTDFLPTAQFPTTGRAVSPIPGNSNIMVNDPSVTIYSLDTMNVSEPQPAPLPPLQPPTNIKGNYPSPFDQNGNPTE